MVDPRISSRVFEIIQNLSHVLNQDLLFDRALKELMELLNVDAGSVYLVKNKQLVFEISKNITLQKKLPFGKRYSVHKEVMALDNSSVAGYVATSGILLNIKDVYDLDSNQPYTVNKNFDEMTGYRTRSMLSIPVYSDAREVVGVVQLINPLMKGEGRYRYFNQEDEEIAELFVRNLVSPICYTQMIRNFVAIICELIHCKNPRETFNHAYRVATISAEIYKNWAYKQGLSRSFIFQKRDKIMTLAFLHDFNLLMGENMDGYDALFSSLVKTNNFLSRHNNVFVEDLKNLILNYREMWNGSGMPGHIDYATGQPLVGYRKESGVAFGKREREIPLGSRIVAVAHYYDYLMHFLDENGKERVLDKQDEKDGVVKRVMKLSGMEFDPSVLSAFVGSLENLEIIAGWV